LGRAGEEALEEGGPYGIDLGDEAEAFGICGKCKRNRTLICRITETEKSK